MASTAIESGTVTSPRVSSEDSPSFIYLHATCPNCHHWYNKHKIPDPFPRGQTFELKCPKCTKKLFRVGMESSQNSFMTRETNVPNSSHSSVDRVSIQSTLNAVLAHRIKDVKNEDITSGSPAREDGDRGEKRPRPEFDHLGIDASSRTLPSISPFPQSGLGQPSKGTENTVSPAEAILHNSQTLGIRIFGQRLKKGARNLVANFTKAVSSLKKVPLVRRFKSRPFQEAGDRHRETVPVEVELLPGAADPQGTERDLQAPSSSLLEKSDNEQPESRRLSKEPPSSNPSAAGLKVIQQDTMSVSSQPINAKIVLENLEGLSSPTASESGLGNVSSASSEASRRGTDRKVDELELGSTRFRSESSVESEDSSTQPSIQGCESLMSTAKRRLLADVMALFHAEYESLIGDRIRAYTQPGKGDTAESTSSLGLNGTPGNSSSKIDSRLAKFPPLGGEETPPGGKENGNKKNPDLPGTDEQDTKTQRKFACIFYKHDPITYDKNAVTGAKYRTCGGPGFEFVSRVKEHLYRRHRAPTHCPRCCLEFSIYEDLTAHLNQEIRCEQQVLQKGEGITIQQYEKLKSKKRPCHDQTEEDRWREAYMICFPDEVVPTPYYDWDTLNAEISAARDIEDLQAYSRRRLPRVVETRLETLIIEKLQPVRDEIIASLGGIVESSISAVFEEWQQNRPGQPPGLGAIRQDSTQQNHPSLIMSPLADTQRQDGKNFEEFLEMPTASFNTSGEVGLGENSNMFDFFIDYVGPGHENAGQERNQLLGPSTSGQVTGSRRFEVPDAGERQGGHNVFEPMAGEGTNLDLPTWQPDTMTLPSRMPDSSAIPNYANLFVSTPNQPDEFTSNPWKRARRDP